METNFIQKLGTSDMTSYINVLTAYQEECIGEEIFQVGFNERSGYLYISLENGIQICSAFGNPVEFLISDFNDGEEHFFDEYEDALEFLETQE